MMRPLLPLRDERIYQVIYSVLEASEMAITHRACLIFASVGTLILREQYGLPATISAGCMALMVDEEKANVVLYGRQIEEDFTADEDAFHAWIECDGWLIDFMAPVMGVALREDGQAWNVPRKALQKPLVDRMVSPRAIQRRGEFYIRHERELVERLLDRQPVQFGDLAKCCLAWFRRPPKPLRDIAMGDTLGGVIPLRVVAPSLEGSW